MTVLSTPIRIISCQRKHLGGSEPISYAGHILLLTSRVFTDIANDVGACLLFFSSLNKWAPYISRLGCREKKNNKVWTNHEFVLGVKLLSLFWCFTHVIGSQATAVVTPYLDSACAVSASKSPTSNTAKLYIRNGPLL